MPQVMPLSGVVDFDEFVTTPNYHTTEVAEAAVIYGGTLVGYLTALGRAQADGLGDYSKLIQSFEAQLEATVTYLTTLIPLKDTRHDRSTAELWRLKIGEASRPSDATAWEIDLLLGSND